MLDKNIFTVLESDLTISGKQLIILNTYDTNIQINSIVFNSKGFEWLIKSITKHEDQKMSTELRRKFIELGAVTYSIEPCQHEKRLEVGDQVSIR